MFKRRNPTEPTSVVSLILESILGLVLGVFIAVVWLAFKPVAIADAAPADNKKPAGRHEVTYIQGNQGMGRGSQWVARQKALVERVPGDLVLGEDDVNRWILATYRDLDLTKKWESYSAELHAVLPAFRFVGAEVEAGMIYELQVMGWKRKFVVQARGVFEKLNGREVFVPREMMLGSCPLPAVTVRSLYGAIASQFAVPEPVNAAWPSVHGAVVEQNKLKLSIGAGT